jgi:Icc-related predicted phosphoesterase
MKVVLLSDTHGYLPEIPECDLMIHAGDICPVSNHTRQYQAQWLRTDFTDWLNKIPANHKVVIAGNHDFVLQESKKIGRELPCHYLQDSSVEIEGFKIHGSPWSNHFGNWAFMADDQLLEGVYSKIADDTDILISHSPPKGYGDRIQYYDLLAGEQDEHVGSQALRDRCDDLNLKLCVFGHIHEGFGETKAGNTTFANVSYVRSDYSPRPYCPIVIDI